MSNIPRLYGSSTFYSPYYIINLIKREKIDPLVDCVPQMLEGNCKLSFRFKTSGTISRHRACVAIASSRMSFTLSLYDTAFSWNSEKKGEIYW